MNIIIHLLLLLYTLLIELIFLFSRPILWLLLPLYSYKQCIKIPPKRDDSPILVHAASVGEINAVAPLINALLEQKHKIHINTITVTGRDLATRSFPGLSVELAPLDVASLRKKQYCALQPKLILIVETELWPLMLATAAKKGIPVIIVNARMGEKSFKRYFAIRNILRYLSRSVCLVLAQSESDKNRFKSVLNTEVEYAGNLKYCLKLPNYDPNALRRNLNFAESDLILVWGSSRPGEESLILSIFPSLSEQFSNLRLIIAPRHPKRCEEVENLLSGFKYQKLSDPGKKERSILLIDSLGNLAKVYAISDLVIVGGSFYDYGGHNPLEAAYYEKAIIMGTYHQSCKASVEMLHKKKAIVISDKESLEENISTLLTDSDLRINLGKNAKLALTENTDALDNHLRGIQRCLN